MSCVFMVFAQPIPRNIRTKEYKELQENVAKGWNTWYNNNMLSHVYLPGGFAINLAFQRVGSRSHLSEIISHDKNSNRLGLRSNFGDYTSMEQNFEGVKYLIESASKDDELYICVTPSKESMNQLIVEATIPWDQEGFIGMKGGSLNGDMGGRKIKVSSVNDRITNNYSGSAAPKLIYSLNDPDVCIYTGADKSRSEIKAIISEAKANQEKIINSYGKLSEAFKAMQTVLSWNTIYDAANQRVISPVFREWSAGWGGTIMFEWDNYFACYMLGMFNKEVAYANAVEMTKAITPNGFVPNYQAPFYHISFDRSQPPVGSMAILALYNKYKDKWLLEEVYDELLTWNRWWPRERDIEGYLSWGSSDFSDKRDAIKAEYIEYAKSKGINPKSIYDNMDKTVPDRQAAAFESGMDNSPAYDEGLVKFNKETNTLNVADVGLMGLYLGDCNNLIEIAKILGKKNDVKEIEKRKKKYAKSLSTLWCKEKGIFLNKNLETGEFIDVLTPFNFFPLIGKACTQKQAEIMMEKHYFNPDEFYGEYVISSVAKNHPSFKDNAYWRGRIWAPLNFLLYKGMCNYDIPEARKDLVQRSLNLLLKNWKDYGSVCENYNVVTGSGGIDVNSNSFYHWGALLSFMSFLEEGYMN